jgi:hypothetical protein
MLPHIFQPMSFLLLTDKFSWMWIYLIRVFVLQLTVGISVSRVGSAAQVEDFA